MVTSQLPVEHWHEALGDPTLADAILDRLVHNAYKITLQGESMRKRQATVDKRSHRRITIYRPASLRSDEWQASPGVGGNLPVVHVAALHVDWVAGLSPVD